MITREELVRIMPWAKLRADVFLSPLNQTMDRYEIIGPLRMAAFLAQIAHESGELRYVRELASGADYDIGRKAVSLGNTPEADGDGQLYKGRGLIQLTGRTNYELCSKGLFGDDRLLQEPELLETPLYASLSAGWFWDKNYLNGLADVKDFRGITRKVNGGYNGFAQRLDYYGRALQVLGEGEHTA